MNNTGVTGESGGKRMIARLIPIFLILMLGLTFFSNTINNFSLPKVVYESVSGGSLVRQVSSSGHVEAADIKEFYIDTSLKVTNILVKVGDTVKKDQLLMKLDTASLSDQLANEKAVLEQRELSLAKLQAVSERSGNTSYDNAVANTDAALASAEESYNTTKSLYDLGGETKQSLDASASNLEKARRDHTMAEADRDAALRNNSSDIRSTQLDIEIQKRKVANLTAQLGYSEIKAPADGVITELNFDEGTTANNSKALYKLADISKGFVFKATVDIDSVDFVKAGDTATVMINSLGGKALDGKILEIADNEQNRGTKKDISIQIPPDGLIGGESGSFNISKNTGYYKTLISNSAVGQDNTGYFVYVISEKRGPLGNEYYIHRANVTILESDSIRTVVTGGLTNFDRVVTSSDKQIADGSKVMLDE